MLCVYDQRIIPEQSTLLWEADFTGDWKQDWLFSRGEWEADGGVLTGRYREDGGALIYSKQQFHGDILLDFWGQLIPPCANDLNLTFRARGWDQEKDDADCAYIAGLNGWWTRRVGLERYPESCPQALTTAFTANSGQDYHIQAGIVGNRCFLAVDGTVLLELCDPNPIEDADCGRVGLGVYASQVGFHDFRVFRPYVEAVPVGYHDTF